MVFVGTPDKMRNWCLQSSGPSELQEVSGRKPLSSTRNPCTPQSITILNPNAPKPETSNHLMPGEHSRAGDGCCRRESLHLGPHCLGSREGLVCPASLGTAIPVTQPRGSEPAFFHLGTGRRDGPRQAGLVLHRNPRVHERICFVLLSPMPQSLGKH